MFKKFASVILTFGFIVTVFSFTSAEENAPDGKTVFEKSKCATCHSVNSLKIEGKKKDKSHDLSNTANVITADEMKTYLKKESDLNGKKHPVAFKGEDSEYQILIDWLGTLKNEEVKEEAK